MGINEPLFGSYANHSARWQQAADIAPDACPGKDTLDVNCKCPDIVYATKVYIRNGTTFDSRIYCGCCERNIIP